MSGIEGRVRRFFGENSAARTPGTRAFTVSQEVDKICGRVQQIEAQLRRGGLPEAQRTQLGSDLQTYRKHLDQYRTELNDLEANPAAARARDSSDIAMPSAEAQKEAARLGYPREQDLVYPGLLPKKFEWELDNGRLVARQPGSAQAYEWNPNEKRLEGIPPLPNNDVLGKVAAHRSQEKGQPIAAQTVAAGWTDIKNLELESDGTGSGAARHVYGGLSPRLRDDAGLQRLSSQGMPARDIKSPDQRNLYQEHAEEDLLNRVNEAIKTAIRSGILKVEDLDGKTLCMHIFNYKGACDPSCTSGLYNLTAPDGVLKQFSTRYPGLRIAVTAEGREAAIGHDVVLQVKNGQVIK